VQPKASVKVTVTGEGQANDPSKDRPTVPDCATSADMTDPLDAEKINW